MESPKHTKNQSNPFSTGGGGANYETKVITHFVLSLLRGTSAPIFKGSTIESIELQTRRLGYDIDDLLIHACEYSKAQHSILCQVKHNFSIAASDKDFVETFSAAWHDFNDTSIFDKSRDLIAIITSSLSAIDFNHARVLFSWARASDSANDFLNRVSLNGFSSKTKQDKLDTIRNLLTSQCNSPISDEMFWEFMKSIHILNYDLEDDSPLLQSIIDQSNNVLGEIILFVEQTNQEAGRICRENIPTNILLKFSELPKDQLADDLQRIQDRNSLVLGTIRESIADIHIDRDDCLSDINDILKNCGAAFLSGNRGCGKSALVKAYIESQSNVFFLVFRAEDLDSSSLLASISKLGINSTLSQLTDYFRLYENKIIVIESLEKILEVSNNVAFQELLSFAKTHKWKMLASIRNYAWNNLSFNFLDFNTIAYIKYSVPEFSDVELKRIGTELPDLLEVITNERLQSIVHNPFYLSMCHRAIGSGSSFSKTDTMLSLRIKLWDAIVQYDRDTRNGIHLSRENTFIDIALKRAKALRYNIEAQGFDLAVLNKLSDDGLISHTDGLVCITHDVMEDWALCKFIDRVFARHCTDPEAFFNEVGQEPAMNRAFRIWLAENADLDTDGSPKVIDFLGHVLSAQTPRRWVDECFVAILNGAAFKVYLEKLSELLLVNDNQYLIELCFAIRISSKSVSPLYSSNNPIFSSFENRLLLVPTGECWGTLLRFLNDNFEHLSDQAYIHYIVYVIDWANSISIFEQPPDYSESAGLLCLKLLNSISNNYMYHEQIEKIYCVLVKTYQFIESEFKQLLELRHQAHSRHENSVRLAEYVVTDFDSVYIARLDPDYLILLTNEYIKKKPKQESFISDLHEREVRFGIDSTHNRDFLHPNPICPPFQGLFKYHFLKGLIFVIDICNYVTNEYITTLRNEGKTEEQLQERSCALTLSNGEKRVYYSDIDFWVAYRGMGNVPNAIQSALIVMETAFIDIFESNLVTSDWIKKVFDFIFMNSNSVLPVAVLASIATGFSTIVGDNIFPLFSSAKTFNMDLTRKAQENMFFFRKLAPYDRLANFINPVIEQYDNKPWRKNSLEDVCVSMQFSDFFDKVTRLIDQIDSNNVGNVNWEFTKRRIDTRGYTYEYSPEHNGYIATSAPLSQELEEVVAQHNKESESMLRSTNVSVWARNAWDNNAEIANPIEMLDSIRKLILLCTTSRNVVDSFLLKDVPLAVVAIIRATYFELGVSDKKWCIDYIQNILQKVGQETTLNTYDDRVDNSEADACIRIIPFLLQNVKSTSLMKDLVEFLIAAITHPRLTILEFTSKVVREQLWSVDPILSEKLLCIRLEYSRKKKENADNWKKFNTLTQMDKIEEAYKLWLIAFRKDVLIKQQNISQYENFVFTILTPVDVAVTLQMCASSEESKLHGLVTCLLSRWFDIEENVERSRHGIDGRISENFHSVSTQCPYWFAEYLWNLQLCDEQYLILLQDACSKAPKFIELFLLHLALLSEKGDNFDMLWRIKQGLSESVIQIAKRMDYKHDYSYDPHSRMIDSFFYRGARWTPVDFERQDVRHGKVCLLNIARVASRNVEIFTGMSELMFHFPRIFVPEGLIALTNLDEVDLEGVIKSSESAQFPLAQALHSYITKYPELNMPSIYYDACLKLLDCLVSCASSDAFYTREYLLRSKKKQ